MKNMKLFIDTHDRNNDTFPDGITEEQFGEFYARFLEACEAEGVVNLRAHVGIKEGRAYCLSMAPDAEAIRRAHERVGLPYDSITEVKTATPGDMFL